MTAHEIKPKQLHGLLLLLVLVPFIPTVLMIRFVVDVVQTEQAMAFEKVSSVYQQTLLRADASLARNLAARPTPITPAELHDFYRTLLDRDVVVRVTDAAGKALTGLSVPDSRPVAQTALKDLGLPWRVQVYLLDPTTVGAEVKEQVRAYAWTVVIAVVSIFSIAIAAGLTVSRQLALRELKNTSVATVAHELRTPLASMRMLVDTLREGRYRSEEQLREYLDLIASENLRLSRLTDNFLTLSRLEHGQHAFDLAPVQPRAVAEQAVQVMRSRLDAAQVDFRCETDDPLPEIQADREALVTVLTNLLDNALKYSGENKCITLRVRPGRGSVSFEVADNGIGLSRVERRHIFEPFQQVDRKLSRASDGCGLGLSIVKHIVNAHRGQISVVSEPEKGSTFVVTLPVGK